MRTLPSARCLAATAATLAAALSGCGLYDGTDTRNSGETYVPPTYPPNAQVFVLDLTRTFSGEQVDVRLDGVRVVRKAVANTTNPALAERLRVAAAPGLHELFVRVTTASGGRLDQTMPIRIGTEACGAVSLTPGNGAAASLRISISPNADCPAN